MPKEPSSHLNLLLSAARPHRRVCALVALLLCVGAGCASPVTYPKWRASVEQYVNDRGQGDPTVLREVTWPQARRTFSVLGQDDPAASQDAKGLLLAYRPIDPADTQQRWFIFLVGIVRHRVVQDIRIQAMTRRGEDFVWGFSPADPDALKAYRDWQQRLWKQRFPGRESAPAAWTGFPSEGDRFSVEVQFPQVLVRHQQSGACWKLTMDRTKTPNPASIAQAR